MEWNEDKTKVTLTKDEFEDQEKKIKSATDKFNDGYGKGSDAGRKEVYKILEPLGIDVTNLEGSLKSKFQLLTDIESGKYPKEITDKFKETEVFKDLQTKLATKTTAHENLEKEFNSFRQKTLIDNKILALARDSKALNAEDVNHLFKMNYQVEVGDNEKITIKKDGTPMFNDKGDEMKLDDVFKIFATARPQLFEGNGSGGSGGGGGGDFAGVTYKDLQNDSEKKMKFIKEKGQAEFQKLVDAHDFTKKD